MQTENKFTSTTTIQYNTIGTIGKQNKLNRYRKWNGVYYKKELAGRKKGGFRIKQMVGK